MLYASDQAPLSSVECCSSITDRNWKGQNNGGALAVTKELVGQAEGLVGKFPPSTLYGYKNTMQSSLAD